MSCFKESLFYFDLHYDYSVELQGISQAAY